MWTRCRKESAEGSGKEGEEVMGGGMWSFVNKMKTEPSLKTVSLFFLISDGDV